MTPLQIILEVELPTAAPLIISGIRSVTVQVIATLTVAAYAPLVGGLGRLIVDGQQDLADPRYGYPAMLAAGTTVAVLAIAADVFLALAQRHLTGTRPDRHPPDNTSQAASRPRSYPRHIQGTHMRRLLPAALILATALVTSACGAPGSSSRTTVPHQVTGAGTDAEPAAPLPASPGRVTMGGSADFPESDCRPISTPARRVPVASSSRSTPTRRARRLHERPQAGLHRSGARVHRVPSSRIWRHRAPLQAGRPDSAHGRCLQRVSAKLTTTVLGELDAQVAKGADPEAVARTWLSANGLA